MSRQPLKVGMIGGGAGAFIGAPHQRAIFFDGTRRVVAGALRSNPQASRRDARNWPYPIQGYGTYDEMIDKESNKPAGEGIDYALIVTPNNAHFDPAMKCIKAGIPVFCEKPLTLTLSEAKKLSAAVKKAKIPFAVAHTYLGHWTSRLSRHIVRSGLLGKVRWVDAYYIQGWLSTNLEKSGSKQAVWRVDPGQAGASGCGGDIGTHALMQLRYVTGLEIERMQAHLLSFIPKRKLDDHFTVYAELTGGAHSLIRASQICIGHLNDLGLKVYGEKGSLIWRQEEPERLEVRLNGQPERIYWRGAVAPQDGFIKSLPKELRDDILVPAGHPEGLHDAFARLHREFETDVRAYKARKKWSNDGARYATVDDGVKGIAFIDAAVRSSRRGGAWVRMR